MLDACFLLDATRVHVQQREEAGEAQRCPVHAQQPHGEYPSSTFKDLRSRSEMRHTSFLLQSEHFSFLGVNNQSNLSDMRCRTTFYTALGRLLMVDLGKLNFIYKHFKSNVIGQSAGDQTI